MYVDNSNIKVVQQTEDIQVVGLNLQGSGLPITFESLGKMWDLYTDERKEKTPNCSEKQVEYGICLNKVPDYIVGMEVTKAPENMQEYVHYRIPAGEYIKVTFNAENHDALVGDKLMKKQKEAEKWAKSNHIKRDRNFTVEVYPKETMKQEYPEMFLLIPISK